MLDWQSLYELQGPVIDNGYELKPIPHDADTRDYFVVLDFGGSTKIYPEDGDGMTSSERDATMMLLSDEPGLPWETLDGKSVKLALEPGSLAWPSQTGYPLASRLHSRPLRLLASLGRLDVGSPARHQTQDTTPTSLRGTVLPCLASS